MGIHGEWMKVFKETCPEAFTARLTGRPRGAFIDGQIQLMKSAHVLTWDQFVHSQFAMPVRRMLREHGATSVVLAFDDYTHVPLAKGMTQAQRQKKTSPKAFHARQQLPDTVGMRLTASNPPAGALAPSETGERGRYRLSLQTAPPS